MSDFEAREIILSGVENIGEGTNRAPASGLPDVVARFDPSGRHLFVSDDIGEMLELSAVQLIGKTHHELGFSDEACRFWEGSIRAVVASGAPLELESTVESRYGPRAFRWRFLPERDTAGQVTSVLSIGRDVTEQRQFACVFADITERKRAEDALRESETRLRTLSDNLPGGLVYQIDSGPEGRERRFTYVSAGIESLHGVTVAEATADARTIYDQVVEEDRALVAEKERRAVELMAPFSAEIRMQPPGEEPRWRILTSAPRRLPNGHLVWDGVELDITELKRVESERQQLQAQLLQAQKMEAVGQLAGGIAHDFNNLLAAMTLQLDMLRLLPSVGTQELHEAIDELLDSANRAANLTRQLLLFSRRQAMKPSRLDVNALVEHLMLLLGRLLGEQVSLSVERGPEALWMEGDAGMIEQLVTNLCVNARDAMPDGGRLSIVTSAVALDLETGKRHGVAPGRYVCLQVVDTGIGMEQEVLEHIFEPFFTTKQPGKGTGLGLATAHGIAARHGGFVDVTSQVGEGSTFSVYLPCAPGDAGKAEQRARAEIDRGVERILVVEDEAQVRNIVVRCLRRLGYHVTEAANGRHALDVWEEHGGAFDLLLTDMVMPEGLSGLELCALLRESRPDLKTIIASGYSAGIIDGENRPELEVRFLSKPYDVKTLAATVREVLKPTA